MKHEELTQKILGCAFTVFNKMGSGYLESVYEKYLMIELRKAGLSAISQHPIEVFYDEEPIGNFIADIFLESQVNLDCFGTVRCRTIHWLTRCAKSLADRCIPTAFPNWKSMLRCGQQ